MRPKKVVLLYCDSAVLHSEINYLLYVRGYSVFATQDLALACRTLMDESVSLDCAVVGMGRGQALEGLAGIRPGLRIVWMAQAFEFGIPKPESIHEKVVMDRSWKPWLLEAIESASVRKRGPRARSIMAAFQRMKEA